MIGCIKAISPCVKSASAKLFLDLHTVLAPSGEERPLNAAAQVERARWCCRRFDSDTQTRCGSVTVMVLVSSASGPRVSGCIRAPRYFHPNFHPILSTVTISQPPCRLQELLKEALKRRWRRRPKGCTIIMEGGTAPVAAAVAAAGARRARNLP